MSAKSWTFFRFWDVDIDLFGDVEVCPLSECRGLPLKPLTLLGMYAVAYRRIYLDDMSDAKTFSHEASHHVIARRMPQLYKTPGPRSGGVGDRHRCNKKMPVPRDVGWLLIEMGLQLKSCHRLHFDKDGKPHLSNKCILATLKAKPKLIFSLFP